MSVATVVTQGFGTFGSTAFVVADGYGDYGGSTGGASPAAPAGPTPAGGYRNKNRRRIMLPDGTLIWATLDEAYDIVNAHFTSKPEPEAPRETRTQPPRQEPVERAAIRWERVPDMTLPTLRPMFTGIRTYQPSNDDYARAIEVLLRRQRDEEAIIALLL